MKIEHCLIIDCKPDNEDIITEQQDGAITLRFNVFIKASHLSWLQRFILRKLLPW